METIGTKNRRVAWWLALPVTMAVLTIAVVVVIKVGSRRAEARWESLLATLRDAGEPVTFADLSKHFEKETNSGTVAELLERHFDGLTKLNAPTVSAEFDQNVLVFGLKSPNVDFFEGIPRYAIEPTREFLAGVEELTAALRTAGELPPGQYFHIDPEHGFGESDSLKELRAAAKLLLLDGTMALISGDTEASAERIVSGFHLAGTQENAPSVFRRLIQISLASIPAKSIEFTLKVGEVSDAQLKRIAEQLEQRSHDSIRWALLGERAHFVQMCEQLYAGHVPTDRAGVTQVNSFMRVAPIRLFTRTNQIRGTEIHSRLIEASGRHRTLVDAIAEMKKEVDALPKRMWLVRNLFADLHRTAVLHTRVLAEIRCAQVIVAAERFRMAQGRLPGSVDELIPQFLAEHPTDPFDEVPMRFLATDEGVVVYSIGENEVDDGGAVTPAENEKRPKDSGFRLFRPELRGIKITDELPQHPDDE